MEVSFGVMTPFTTSQLDVETQAPDPVTIPFVEVIQEADATVDPAVPLILKLLLAPILKLTSPVDPPPKVRVCLFVV